ncbi:TrmH family RNA methyltransferase [Actomonas aquatica]|uniref:RNA methyltransferase n=1 Tax=Actomonas aquatica TaxID=2866162 RepID=A0ABZ1C2N1_9BACT|nr:RNA methyltransferase [Opitutus sp. WL0086]WRQ85696.1 RNA methyltransferase [Opitutus sp. WL0086]
MPLTKAQIQRLRSLRQKKTREETGLYVVEGPKVVTELLAAGHPFAEVYATPDWTQPAGAAVEIVTASEMERMSHYPTPSPVLAVGRIARAELAAGELTHGLTLALDGIQDPGNVGTLLRIADWFGFERVLLSPDCADLFSQKVINASMGSFAHMRVITTDLAPALAAAAPTVPVYGCDLDGTPLSQLQPPVAAVVVIGSEGRGLSAAVASTLSERITIPRHGGAESLNAAVAAGIVCAHLRP